MAPGRGYYSGTLSTSLSGCRVELALVAGICWAWYEPHTTESGEDGPELRGTQPLDVSLYRVHKDRDIQLNKPHATRQLCIVHNS